MQIDGHHTGTYVAARAAGFSHDEAAKIAYAAQYVDDATNDGVVYFRNSEYMYFRIAPAHSMLDRKNLNEASNHLSWLPFHFLPGNGGLPADSESSEHQLDKLICKPDSPVARDMLREAFKDKGTERALHRLGIAMHVYADTFSHQDFVGAMSSVNRVTGLGSDDPATDKILLNWFRLMREKSGVWLAMLICYLVNFFKWAKQALVYRYAEGKWPDMSLQDLCQPEYLGHVQANQYPDLPYLVWHCDQSGEKRDNPQRYLRAFDMMTRAMRAWREDDDTMNLEKHDGLSSGDSAVVERLLREAKNIDGNVRKDMWLESIANGAFSFGPAELEYVVQGKDSWKGIALYTSLNNDYDIERYVYSDEFLKSDWKLFHDAVQVHRSAVVHDILPRYGICAA